MQVLLKYWQWHCRLAVYITDYQSVASTSDRLRRCTVAVYVRAASDELRALIYNNDPVVLGPGTGRTATIGTLSTVTAPMAPAVAFTASEAGMALAYG